MSSSSESSPTDYSPGFTDSNHSAHGEVQDSWSRPTFQRLAYNLFCRDYDAAIPMDIPILDEWGVARKIYMKMAWNMLNSRLIPEPLTCLKQGLCEPWELQVVEKEQPWLYDPEDTVMIQEAEVLLGILATKSYIPELDAYKRYAETVERLSKQ